MNRFLSILVVLVFVSGCTGYSKVTQLTPQKAVGWKLSNDMSINQCNDVDVWVGPIFMSYDGSGTDVLFVPIPSSDKESLDDASNKNSSLEVTFKHWYRDENIESCSLSFIQVKDLDLSKVIKPVSVEKFTTGEHVTKYSTICTYSFNSSDITGSRYSVQLVENALGCRLEPIPILYEKKTSHFIYDVL